ncbi:MAG TPA: protein-L-isoaspartate(D-aspartate) O-methyltransferase [Dongiaceae bacterium]|nr:protein-L-isoaspartate(D-aspartate) O-methyltransferase [Dongiaceae bacterium]
MNESTLTAMRQEMVEMITAYASMVGDRTGRQSLDERVLAAMAKVPRHEFVPLELRQFAYVDSPLPIGYDKTISQPFIVALMTDLLDLKPDDTVLEIGTGLGYQAAVLSELAGRVYSVEIIEELATEARRRLKQLGYDKIEQRLGDGSQGWVQHGPYGKILVTAAPELIPPPLLNQLKPEGRMVLPAGIEDAQQLILVEKDRSGRIKTTEILPVRFLPLVTSH